MLKPTLIIMACDPEFYCGRPVHVDLPPWLSGLAISGCGAVKAWLAIWQGVGSTPAPVGMSSQVSA